nr:hypothetical protein [Tanacetum cinerariifolium]
MTKVIKREFEKLEDLNDKDVSLTCSTSLQVFNNKFNRMSGMDDDLSTYEVANIRCDSNKDNDSEKQMSHESNDDMGYDPSDIAFTEWLESKIFNYKTMYHCTKKALWIYWRGDDEVELTDEEFSDNEDEVAKVFRIDTNIFDFDTPMCKAFKEFNYLLQIDPYLLTKDIEGFKTYKEWQHIVGRMIDTDYELKQQALRNKAIMEGSISDEKLSNNGWRRWEIHEITYHDHDEIEYENETHDERQELCEARELTVDVTGTIVVLIERVWDVNAITERYLSTDFVVSDSKVTLWGKLGDVLVKKKTKHTGVCAMVLTGMSGKEYNNKLYLSSTSFTVFCNDDDIPCLQELKADDRTKKGWNYPSYGYEKCRYSCETSKEIWERVRQMMKGSDIGEQEKKAKLFNKWEKFTNKHSPKNIVANLRFLNNLEPEWKRHVTIVRQTKNLHEADFTQIYDLNMNQDEVNELRVERLVKTHDPLALMAYSQNSYNFPATHNDQSSSSTHSQQSFPINNKYNPQSSLNQNFMQPPMTSLEDINDPTEAMNAALILFAKAFPLTAPTNSNQRISFNPRNYQIAQSGMNMSQDRQIQNNGGIQVAQNVVQIAGAQNGAKEFDFMAAACDLDEIEEVNANCILMANLQHASTSGTQLDEALVYDTDGSAEVLLNENCYDNEIFNMFTQEEPYRDLLEPILEPQLVPQNDNHVTSVAPSMVQSGGTVETSSAPNEETCAHQETVYRNLVDQVAKARLRDLKGKSSDTPGVSNTLDPLNQKLETKIVELEFQVFNYEREISHLKTTYKNLFDSITSNRAHAKLHDLIYENAKLRARLFENTSESINNTSRTSVTPQVDKPNLIVVTPYSEKLHASIPSHFVPQPKEFHVVKHSKVIAPRMFKIDPS